MPATLYYSRRGGGRKGGGGLAPAAYVVSKLRPKPPLLTPQPVIPKP